MQRLTVAGRLLITVLILAALYFGLKYIGGVDLLKKLQSRQQTTEQSDSPSMPGNNDETASASSDNSAASDNSSESSSEASDSGPRKSFDYTAQEPVGGRLKGVVELGASGFNSFIVRVDDQKRWKLEKAEFGNSLVIENMATDQDIRDGLKKYIATMLDFGVGGRDIHFVVSSGAVKADGTQKIIKVLKSLNYFVNTVTPEQEGRLALRSVLPGDFEDKAFVVDIGSGNTKISWKEGGDITALEAAGSKYFQNGETDQKVYDDVSAKSKQVPSAKRKTCFIIGGIPFELAKQVRNGKERYTVLKAPGDYKGENAKQKAGINIYKAIADATGCEQFVFDWDANFTIGYLLTLK
nr:hypothetical protein [uncultured Arsenicibacter sp.]